MSDDYKARYEALVERMLARCNCHPAWLTKETTVGDLAYREGNRIRHEDAYDVPVAVALAVVSALAFVLWIASAFVNARDARRREQSRATAYTPEVPADTCWIDRVRRARPRHVGVLPQHRLAPDLSQVRPQGRRPRLVVHPRPQAGVMRDRNCPNCGHPVYRNHHCRASRVLDPPVPLDRAKFDAIRKQARDELEAQANADAQLTIPLGSCAEGQPTQGDSA